MIINIYIHKVLKLLLNNNSTEYKFGAGGWIRTTEAFASELQSDPFDRSGTPA